MTLASGRSADNRGPARAGEATDSLPHRRQRSEDQHGFTRRGASRLALLAGLVPLPAALAGCGLPARAPAEGPTAGKAPVTIEHWGPSMNQAQTETTAQIIQEFQAKYGYVTVQTYWQAGGWDPLVEKVYTAIASNTPPSNARLPDNVIKQLIDRGVFAPMDPFIKKDRAFDPKAFLDIQYLRGRGFKDGKQYTLPWQASVLIPFYNLDLFEKAGAKLPPPTQPMSWGDFVDAAVKIRRLGEDTWGWRFDTFNPTWSIVKSFLPWLWSNGAEWVDQTETKPLFNSERGIETLQLWGDLIHRYKVAPGPGMSNPSGTSGKVGMWVGQGTNIVSIRTSAPTMRYGSTLIPKGKGKESVSVQAGSYAGIIANTRHQEESWSLLRWFTTEENNRRWCADSFHDPVNKASFSKPPFSEVPAYKAILEQFKAARTRPDNPAYRPSEDTTAAEIISVLKGEKGAAAAMQTAAEQAIAIIAAGRK